MTPQDFIRKWKPVALTERAAAQTHFNDLCALVGHDPIKADPTGEAFTFEKGVTKTGGGDGFADVWKKDFFAWEYKKKKRNLDEALAPLVRYAAALVAMTRKKAPRERPREGGFGRRKEARPAAGQEGRRAVHNQPGPEPNLFRRPKLTAEKAPREPPWRGGFAAGQKRRAASLAG